VDVFRLRNQLVENYAAYTRSFIKIADEDICQHVESELGAGALWPQPLLQLNPTFRRGGLVEDLVAEGLLHPRCGEIFRIDKSESNPHGLPLSLHQHQADAVRKSREGRSYVLTSGTGSGKSLTYIIPIVDHVLRRGSGRGIQAIVVYPMNALANSQLAELSKFLGIRDTDVTFARYTGQESTEERERIRSNPPDILLTNYTMLELLLTRSDDRAVVRAADGLAFLVFDELHTYRGRQGADVAMLIRRCRIAFNAKRLVCIGTSATMASGGTSVDQAAAVAKVASTLFGDTVDPTAVIAETLERATPELDLDVPEVRQALRAAISSGASPPADYETFRTHPMASWIESIFGVRSEAATGRLIRQTPRPLRGGESAASALATLTGTDESRCGEVIEAFLMRGSQLRASGASRFPIFTFRLHQFITRGDTVWSTLEAPGTRYLSLSKLVAQPGHSDRPLYPLVFCRHCGTSYARVWRTGVADQAATTSAARFLPRDDRPEEDEDQRVPGYLHLGQEQPWPEGDHQSSAILNRVPGFMKELAPNGEERIDSRSRRDLPTAVSLSPTGQVDRTGNGLRAAFIPGQFIFCLNPACGVAHARNQKSERSKLLTLGVDNRSTATTILAVQALSELQSDTTLERQARKLLSFTDNRQDASLQAGHFNDFAQVALLRSALHKALAKRGDRGLAHAELAPATFDAMSLRFDDYAADPDLRGPARSITDDALRKVIEYYIYRDLQAGWRFSAPNLEDCGLLRIVYHGLDGADGLLADAEVWSEGFFRTNEHGERVYEKVPAAIAECPDQVRRDIVVTLLHALRRNLVLKVDVLDRNRQQELATDTRARLLEGTVWHLDDPKQLASAEVAYPRAKRGQEFGFFVSSRGAIGRYLRRSIAVHATDELKGPDIDEAIRYLFMALGLYGIVEQVRSGTGGPGYQINHAALRWFVGDGVERPADRLRVYDEGETPLTPNAYFQRCYETFADLKSLLEAREHTAQVHAEARKRREELFREAKLPLLFCSPTMELGVDIAQLNVVNLRNVPPTPANYAQRSGRAGRSGQPALVYTYCAGRSPHDQYYFRRPSDMVAGAVAPPRIDLANRDLLQAHLQAIWMEIAKPDLGQTLTSVLDIDRSNGQITLRVKPALSRSLEDPALRIQALARGRELVDSVRDHLAGASWFHEEWVREVLDRLPQSFNSACDRWRELYRAATRQRELHHHIVGDHARPERERLTSSRLRAQAEAQLKILTEAEGVYEGDFYSYRYFASEGFLPGYNFPRLPISAYVPGRRNRDEYVSRPRFLAISEFGPRSLIYHEGARYRVERVNLDFGSSDIEAPMQLPTVTMKRCSSCGYAHIEDGHARSEVCDRCHASLADPTDPTEIREMVRLQSVSLRLAERITCDEEERQRFGYRILTAYRFPSVGGRLDRRDADVRIGDRRVMRLSYGDAATLFRINTSWANSPAKEQRGFVLDVERGYWARNPAELDADTPDAPATLRVVPFVTDDKNALVVAFEPTPPREAMAALQAALKRAIEKVYQLESRELAAEAMPSPQKRHEILLYESAEGGAGVLRQLVDDPRAIERIASAALELCHFDPETLEDLGAATCGKACYQCLLDYGNQPDHAMLDRHRIRDLLNELRHAQCLPSGGIGTREGRMVALRGKCDSGLEKRWLDELDALRLTPPSHAQHLIAACSTRPDFFYAEHNVAVYIDGPPHDTPEQRDRDAEITATLQQHGYAVVRFHHRDDWGAIFRRHPDIFGTPTS